MIIVGEPNNHVEPVYQYMVHMGGALGFGELTGWTGATASFVFFNRLTLLLLLLFFWQIWLCDIWWILCLWRVLGQKQDLMEDRNMKVTVVGTKEDTELIEEKKN